MVLAGIADESSRRTEYVVFETLPRRLHRRPSARTRTVPYTATGDVARLRVYDAEEAQASSNLQQIETEHREILTAVQSGDAEKARILMIAHQARTRDLRIAAMARR